jgi:hypothetical protein
MRFYHFLATQIDFCKVCFGALLHALRAKSIDTSRRGNDGVPSRSYAENKGNVSLSP